MGVFEWNMPYIFQLIYVPVCTHLGKNKELAYPAYQDCRLYMFFKKRKEGDPTPHTHFIYFL